MKKKRISLVMALILVLTCVIGGTLAWLTDKTAEVKNTFTVGDINIALGETTTDYKMVPGNPIAKDPKVTVVKNSEDCWLFVKVDESTNFGDFMTYEIADGWTKLEAGVYYRTVDTSTEDAIFPVLKNNQVIVSSEVTKAQLTAVKETNKPTLTFTAYAIQKDAASTAADAWAKTPKN
ncbi:SipW-dependent-type signal peptide-containing protein [Clostridium sp.]|uniref:SipW-dependent-type signal peptide-containing protein n=1 Tax=Clostridium sp. TaxID=1506 RepID=UPI00290DA0E9|nr:SipW-dependent-type signal peptide-containing protein [Clostridium sp.]MDU5106874.1 SipW-dependent-type signal peptide-containing protein [Clostridium sp.]